MAQNNPYIGPASFGKENRKYFFGRDDEARELTYLLIARRAVLLYAQSGAGKTSLLQAKVIPDLEDAGEMQVLPITRVSGPATGDNVYVANALAGFKAAGATLTDALKPLVPETRPGEEGVPHLLIFDQFEEIFSFRPELGAQRLAFFQQLGECLEAYPQLGLLLSMREDYLADLDSFASYLPDRLRTRMRMERLSDTQAVSAIAQPAAMAGKPFDSGVARKLTDDLRRVQTVHSPANGASGDGHALGKYVEPVQLQIVCRQLWSKLPDSAVSITAEQVDTLARVDDALTNFYRESLAAVRQAIPALSERRLREWFGGKLITSAKTRSIAYRGVGTTDETPEGLRNDAVDILAGKYIIRADVRPSGTWYEIAHDRLVEPIIADNRDWLASYKNPVADAYQVWVAAGSAVEKLLNGSRLAEASDYAARNPAELTKPEQDFLNASVTEDAKARQRRRAKWAAASAVLLVVLVLAGIAAWQGVLAKRNLEQVQKFVAHAMVEKAGTNSRERPDQSLAYLEDALLRDPASSEARSWVSSILLLGRLRWLPVSVNAPFQADKALKVSARADGMVEIAGKGAAVFATVPAPQGTTVAWLSEDHRHLKTSTADGTPGIQWDATLNPDDIPAFTPDGLPDLVLFTADGNRIVTRATGLEMWNAHSGAPLGKLLPGVNGTVFDVSAGGEYAAIGDGAGFVRRVKTATGEPGPKIPYATQERASLSGDGAYLATIEKDGEVRWWVAGTGQMVKSVQTKINPDDSRLFPAKAVFAKDRIAIGGSDSYDVYEVATGKNAGSRNQMAGDLEDLALSPDGRLVATVTSPGLLMVWAADSGIRAATPMMDGSFLTQVMFDADGRRILTRARDVARLWDIESGQTVSVVIQEPRMSDLRFSLDGQFVATATNANGVHVHRVWIGPPPGSSAEGELLAEVAGTAGGYRLNSQQLPEALEVSDWTRRVVALRAIAAQAPPKQPTVASFLREYFLLDRD